MGDLNVIFVALGSMMYVIPAISVFSAFGACCFIVYKDKKLEAKYVDKFKLLGTLELHEISSEETKSADSEGEIELIDLQANDVSLTGTNFDGEFTV